MPELHFKDRVFVYDHHLSVAFRPLAPQPDKSCGSNQVRYGKTRPDPIAHQVRYGKTRPDPIAVAKQDLTPLRMTVAIRYVMAKQDLTPLRIRYVMAKQDLTPLRWQNKT